VGSSRAARIGAAAAAPAAEPDLIEFGARVRFRHPLVRSAVYRAASVSDSQEAHGALAAVTDPDRYPDRRAWHRAQAAPGPDEDIAAELERSARRAQARGGLAAADAFLERAVALTLDPARALAAAQAKVQAGAFDASLDLLTIAEAGPLDELRCARVDLLRAQVAYAQNRGSDALPLLLRAAKRLEPLARETYLDALSAAVYLGRLAGSAGLAEVAQAALAALRPHPSRPCDLLLNGLATRFTGGYTASAPMLKRALSAYPSQIISSEEALRWLWLALQAAVDLWDDQMWEVLTSRHVSSAARPARSRCSRSPSAHAAAPARSPVSWLRPRR
jgi:hypothetical protein